MKIKFISILILIPLLLFGCSEELNFESGNIATYPDNVRNETVSNNMYEASMEYLSSSKENSNEIKPFLKPINKSPEEFYDDLEYLDDSFVTLLGVEEFILGLEYVPVTEADFEIDEHFSVIVNEYPLMIEALTDYLMSYDESYLRQAKVHNESIETSTKAMTKTLKKYELY